MRVARLAFVAAVLIVVAVAVLGAWLDTDDDIRSIQEDAD